MEKKNINEGITRATIKTNVTAVDAGLVKGILKPSQPQVKPAAPPPIKPSSNGTNKTGK